MKTIKSLKMLLVISTFVVVGTGHAFQVGKPNQECRDPKFKTFNPPERKPGEQIPEVEAGSEISFTVSGYADPETFKVSIRKKVIKPKIEDKMSFYRVSAKVPEEFVGKFARIDMRAGTKANECDAKDGWLIKVKAPASSAETIAEEQSDPEAPKKQEVVSKEVKEAPVAD